MKILGIDTSSKRCTTCILEDNNVIAELHSDDEKTHSQTLMPLIDKMFTKTNLTLNDIDLLACSIGPGSFTGVRIGISTAKAFAEKEEAIQYLLSQVKVGDAILVKGSRGMHMEEVVEALKK